MLTTLNYCRCLKLESRATFYGNFEHVPHVNLVSLFLTLNTSLTAGYVALTHFRPFFLSNCFVLSKTLLITMKTANMYLANICLLKVNNRNTRKRCKICLEWTIKTSERRY